MYMSGFRSASAAALRKHSRGRPIRTPRGNAAYSNERPFLRMKSASLVYASQRAPATAWRLKASAEDSRNRRAAPGGGSPRPPPGNPPAAHGYHASTASPRAGAALYVATAAEPP